MMAFGTVKLTADEMLTNDKKELTREQDESFATENEQKTTSELIVERTS